MALNETSPDSETSVPTQPNGGSSAQLNRRVSDRVLGRPATTDAERVSVDRQVAQARLFVTLRRFVGAGVLLWDLPHNGITLMVNETGVYLIQAVHLPGNMVHVMRDSVLVDGVERDLLAELTRAGTSLRNALQDFEITPRLVVVVTGYRRFQVREAPAGGTVVSMPGLPAWLERRAAAVSPAHLSELAAAVAEPARWGHPSDWTPTLPDESLMQEASAQSDGPVGDVPTLALGHYVAGLATVASIASAALVWWLR